MPQVRDKAVFVYGDNMAGYRQFHTQFWKDEWVLNLDPLKRYLFIYLFTNDLSSISGLYKIPLKVVANETDLGLEFVKETFAEFEAAQKILYADGVLWVVNMQKFHKNASPKTMTHVKNDVANIPDCFVKRAYLYHAETGKYSIDKVSIPIPLSSSIRSNSIINSSEEVSEKEPDPFDDMKMLCENLTGRLMIQSDISTINKFIEQGIIEQDIANAIKWWTDTGKVITRIGQLENSVLYQKGQRIQTLTGGVNGGEKQNTMIGDGGVHV